MSTVHVTGFTAHNVRLDDGSFTFPQAAPIDQMGDYLCVKGLLPLLYPEGWEGRSIVDLGCLEGGFATEFARLGLAATGIDVRESNIANAEYIRSKTSLPNLRFIRDDAWNVGRHGPFDLVFCVGLHYHIEDQRRFLHEMSRSCRKAIFIDTHVAPEFDHEPAVVLHDLSPLTVHEGLPGRWYPEHDLDPRRSSAELERLKWSSWENKRSFWPTRGGLLYALRRAGFGIVLEDFDKVAGSEVRALSPEGWNYLHNRSMFVGIKTQDAHEQPNFDAPAHALNGSLSRDGSTPAAEDPTEGLRLRIERLRAELATYEASTSWKITAPLRALRRMASRA
jgi:SAM-dependent methyltransferase